MEKIIGLKSHIYNEENIVLFQEVEYNKIKEACLLKLYRERSLYYE